MKQGSPGSVVTTPLLRIKTVFLQFKDGFKKLPKLHKILLYIIGFLAALALINHTVEASWSQVKNPNYGVSFSTKYAQELGVDWENNFTALLEDMGLRRFRLMSYWDTIEAEKGKFTFQDLDWQMDKANEYGAKVSLSLGLRQPRWPECHAPSWYNPLDAEGKEKALLEFLEKVVTRYKDHPALESYQLENEAVNRHFGTCSKEDMDQERLAREYRLVKSLDTHPVYMSLSDQHGLPLGEPVPDKYGFSVYRTVWNDKFGPFKMYVTYPTPVWYHKLRAQWIESFKDREIFIHELQLEPWGPKATKDLNVAEQSKSMSEDKIRENLIFARKIGTPEIYTWGGEWWYWRMVQGDSSIWQTVKKEIGK